MFYVLRKLLTAQVLPGRSTANLVQAVLTITGVFMFLAGVMYLPNLAPSRVEMFVLLLLLAIVALACTTVGQLAVIIEKLEKKNDNK